MNNIYGHGEIYIESNKLGENIKNLEYLVEEAENENEPEEENNESADNSSSEMDDENEKAESSETNSETKSSEESENSKNKKWHNYSDFEVYKEVFDNEDGKLFVLYRYDVLNNVLIILYDTEEYYRNSYTIENFRNGDYGINLPRYHKLLGSLNAKVEEEKKPTLDLDVDDLFQDESTGGSELKVGEMTLGRDIREIYSLEDYRGEEVIRYEDFYRNSYFYYKDSQKLEISYGEFLEDTATFSNEIVIDEFVNGDYNIFLPFTPTILWGSKYRKDGTQEEYELTGYIPKGGFTKSYGKGNIKVDGKIICTGKLSVQKSKSKKKETDNIYIDEFGNTVIHDILESKLIIIPKMKSKKPTKVDKVVIEEYIDGDFGINVKNPVNFLCGSGAEDIHILKEEETLSELAKNKYGDGNFWRKLLKENGKNVGEKEARKLKVGQKIFFPREKEELFDFSTEYDYENEKKDNKEVFGNGKLKVKGKYLGKDLILIDEKKNIFINKGKVKFIKYGNFLDIKYTSGMTTKDLVISNFKEGDFGLWICEEAPYYYENNQIILKGNAQGKEEKEIKTLNLDENTYIWSQKRIKSEYLWINKNEKIYFYEKGEEAPSFLSMFNFSGSNLVVEGAKCKCSGGTALGILSVTNQTFMHTNDKLIATIKDKDTCNISPMGNCLLSPSKVPPPCTLMAIGMWDCKDSPMDVGGIKAITETSKLSCSMGGTITIVDSNQKTFTLKRE